MPARGLAARRCAEYRRAVRAVVFDRYGPPDVLRLEERDRPVPADDQVLIRVRATSVTRTDVGLRSAEIPISRFVTGLLRPKPGNRILGMEVAGTVESVGSAVTEFGVGDDVFGITGAGAHAEYVVMRETAALADKPPSMTFEEAAAVCDGMSLALPSLEAAGVGEGTRLLIYGASGSVGTAAVQLAHHLGAHVTAVTETRSLELVRSLGADEVVDFTTTDFADVLTGYDVVLDSLGGANLDRSLTILKPGGLAISVVGPPDAAFAKQLGQPILRPVMSLMSAKVRRRARKLGVRYSFFFMHASGAQLRELAALYDAGQLRPVLDKRSFDFDQTPDALAYVEQGKASGKVVITL